MYKSTDGDNLRIMGGATMRIRFDEIFGIEGSINYREDQYGNGFVTARSWPVMVTGLIYPIPVLYGAIGAGWYNTTVSYTIPSGFGGDPASYTEETMQKFGWHFGGGLELPMGDVASFVGDLRYVFLDYDFKNAPGSNGVKSDFYVASVGILFKF
jgi:hypothetical protein